MGRGAAIFTGVELVGAGQKVAAGDRHQSFGADPRGQDLQQLRCCEVGKVIEREITGRPADIRLAARQKHSAPKVAVFFAWAESQLTLIPGKGDLAKAFRYGLSRKDAFSLFLSDGRVAIDNNPAERALRPIGIGRKNWLFAGADTGAETLARAMTIIETAKMNGLDQQAYLANILARINDHKINRLGELLPWNWSPLPTSLPEAA
jgi:transposase